MIPVAYCHECLKAGVVAVVNGPTCTHGDRPAGLAWWPTEPGVVLLDWLKARESKKPLSEIQPSPTPST